MKIRKSIPRNSGVGHDRIEWFDDSRRVRATDVVDAASVSHVKPGAPARRPGKWRDQLASQGHYWCAGTQSLIWHESMMEFTALMMLDHLFDIVAVYPQPMMLTFAEGRHHVPDYLVDTAQGERILVDVHAEEMTTEEDVALFGLTEALCSQVGWRYELIDRISDITRWNLEMMARYNHPRYAPDDITRARVIKLAQTHRTFGALRSALATSRPGEHLPALFHLMWNRAIRFDLQRPFTDHTALRVV